MASSPSALRYSCRRPGARSGELDISTPAKLSSSCARSEQSFLGQALEALEEAFHRGELTFRGSVQHLAQPAHFPRLLNQLSRKKWVVYAKPPFGGAEHVLQYLARYTHRVAISNHRLARFDGNQVTFGWKDYAHSNNKRKMTVSADEFLRRFLLHVLPGGFTRIRYFGFVANRCRAVSIELCRTLLPTSEPVKQDPARLSSSPPTWPCPHCAGVMIFAERLSAAQTLRYVKMAATSWPRPRKRKRLLQTVLSKVLQPPRRAPAFSISHFR